jgi:hypothetical protein
MGKVVQLIHLVVADLELLELGRSGDHGQHVTLVHDRPEQLVEDLDRVVLDVKVGRSAAEVGGVKVAWGRCVDFVNIFADKIEEKGRF